MFPTRPPPSSSCCSYEYFFFAAICKAACKMSCKALGGAFSFAALQVPPQPGSAPPHTALPPLRQTLAPAHSTQASLQQTLAPMQSSLAQPRLPTEPVRQGSDSLRSSDEFPANKENSHGQWPPLERRAAPVAKAVATAGSGAHAAGVVSEQVLAQETVYALQVTAVLTIHSSVYLAICPPIIDAVIQLCFCRIQGSKTIFVYQGQPFCWLRHNGHSQERSKNLGV